eukprot:CAMPEP_0183376310 /NCGR_PEP_ID=MMETSP0164_2-20130417/119920_1 /TAXON_ID=221442 /ORGANISM="Coccolithus pelagicus ssp braarudi, Strain PLY182g" /LENGTH=71 /DNA_ID=CAMNT_0025553597 /DNA_START=103 /DNA_END=314 /DNA_ORIENTATION=-
MMSTHETTEADLAVKAAAMEASPNLSMGASVSCRRSCSVFSGLARFRPAPLRLRSPAAAAGWSSSGSALGA